MRALTRLGVGVSAVLTLVLTPGVAANAAGPAEQSGGRALYRQQSGPSWVPPVRKLSTRLQPTPSARPAITRLLSSSTTSANQDISGDGRFVTFTSDGAAFVTDTSNGATTGVSSAGGGSHPTIGDDGRLVSYLSGGVVQVRDLRTGVVTPITPGDGTSSAPQISADGSTVVFTSYSETYGDGAQDNVFAYQRATGRVTNLTPGPGGGSDPSVSADGSVVAFWSEDRLTATDTDSSADVYRWRGGRLELVSGSNSPMLRPSVSANGNRIAHHGGDPFSEDGHNNVYLWDAAAGTTAVTTGTVDASVAAISGDGSQVAYSSNTSGQYEVYRYTVATRTSERLTTGNSASLFPVISRDGSAVAFASRASNLVAHDPNGAGQDVFIWRR